MKKSFGPDIFNGKFYQTFNEEQKSIFLKIFKKIEEEEALPNSLYDTIILILKPDKGTLRKLETNIFYEYWCRNPEQNTSKPKPAIY